MNHGDSRGGWARLRALAIVAMALGADGALIYQRTGATPDRHPATAGD